MGSGNHRYNDAVRGVGEMDEAMASRAKVRMRSSVLWCRGGGSELGQGRRVGPGPPPGPHRDRREGGLKPTLRAGHAFMALKYSVDFSMADEAVPQRLGLD